MGKLLKNGNFQNWVKSAKRTKQMSIPLFWGNVCVKKCRPFLDLVIQSNIFGHLKTYKLTGVGARDAYASENSSDWRLCLLQYWDFQLLNARMASYPYPAGVPRQRPGTSGSEQMSSF